MMRFMLLLSALLALLAISLLAVGPLGFRFGWWSYSIALRTLMPWAAYAGIAGLVASAISIVVAIVKGELGSISWWALASILVSGAVVVVTLQAGATRNVYPPINDIGTDTINPPAFVAGLPLRLTDGGSHGVYKPETAEVQKKSYPDISPLKLAISQADAFKQAADVATRMPGWSLIAVDPGAGRLEASQASRWFAFVDDVAIRVSADGSGSRVDVRSASRHGRGDFGVNATRVRAYLDALRQQAK